MHYQVRFVSDHSLPAGVTWVFARLAGETILFIKQSAIDVTSGHCDALTRAWAAWEAAEARSVALTA